MKKNAYLLLLFLTVFSIVTIVNVSSPSKASNTADYTVTTSDQCSNPKVSISISSVPNLTYNATSLSLPEFTCANITFSNFDTVGHTFTINSDYSRNISYFNIFLFPNTQESRNFMTSPMGSKINYFCSVPGHEAAGQVGQMFVGPQTYTTTSSSISGNTFPIIFVFVILLLVIIGFGAFAKIRSKQINSESKLMGKSINKVSFNLKNDNYKNLICSKCQAKVKHDDVFCQNCGNRL